MSRSSYEAVAKINESPATQYNEKQQNSSS